MRLTKVRIDKWRNFEDVIFDIPPDTPLVCLVGENGAGKSNILELLSAVAPHLGISAGVEQRRGDPFGEGHSVEVILNLELEQPEEFVGPENLGLFGAALTSWDGTLNFHSRRDGAAATSESQLLCGGVEDAAASSHLASHLVSLVSQRKETQHVYIDADRAYPPFSIAAHQIGEILAQPWEDPQYTKRFAYRPTRTQYEEWVKYFLARESKEATEFYTETRRAVLGGASPPEFKDPFQGFRNSIREVLPHLEFVGVDTQRRELLFDTVGKPLAFSNLSGGEREIAFILGQIDRFQLRSGLMLLDEPELHLNPDLLRTWLAFLRDTVEHGQVWIATHSLEAVEVAGEEASFLLERDRENGLVKAATSLRTRPVVRALSSAVGSPAFSTAAKRFVWVEGDRQSGERERFYRICGDASVNRFIEAGGCTEVARKLATVLDLADGSGEEVRSGGVIDRDFRSPRDVSTIQSIAPVYVLECHEIENLFLHPPVLERVGKALGLGESGVANALQEASDRFAGLWILRRTATLRNDLVESDASVRKAAGSLGWDRIHKDKGAAAKELSALSITPDATALKEALSSSIEQYEKTRSGEELWKKCLGKEVLGVIAQSLGLSGRTALEQHVLYLWKEGEVTLPEEARKLQAYVASL